MKTHEQVQDTTTKNQHETAGKGIDELVGEEGNYYANTQQEKLPSNAKLIEGNMEDALLASSWGRVTIRAVNSHYFTEKLFNANNNRGETINIIWQAMNIGNKLPEGALTHIKKFANMGRPYSNVLDRLKDNQAIFQYEIDTSKDAEVVIDGVGIIEKWRNGVRDISKPQNFLGYFDVELNKISLGKPRSLIWALGRGNTPLRPTITMKQYHDKKKSAWDIVFSEKVTTANNISQVASGSLGTALDIAQGMRPEASMWSKKSEKIIKRKAGEVVSKVPGRLISKIVGKGVPILGTVYSMGKDINNYFKGEVKDYWIRKVTWADAGVTAVSIVLTGGAGAVVGLVWTILRVTNVVKDKDLDEFIDNFGAVLKWIGESFSKETGKLLKPATKLLNDAGNLADFLDPIDR